MSLAEQILRKLLTDDGWEQHYVDLGNGIFDCRVDLTDEEVAYCRTLRDGQGLAGEGRALASSPPLPGGSIAPGIMEP
jgi:hypothetical protein